MNDGIMAVVVFVLLTISSLGTDTVDRREDAYLLEMGVPHCAVFDYDCSLKYEGTTNDL